MDKQLSEISILKSPTRLGYEILRDHVLPSILGKHENDILYWAGKDVARHFPIFSLDELPTFFLEAGWGVLQLEKENKEEAIYFLQTDEPSAIEHRSFQLEAGFIAEQHQKLNGFLTECHGQKLPKNEMVRFTVKWDRKTLTSS